MHTPALGTLNPPARKDHVATLLVALPIEEGGAGYCQFSVDNDAHGDYFVWDLYPPGDTSPGAQPPHAMQCSWVAFHTDLAYEVIASPRTGCAVLLEFAVLSHSEAVMTGLARTKHLFGCDFYEGPNEYISAHVKRYCSDDFYRVDDSRLLPVPRSEDARTNLLGGAIAPIVYDHKQPAAERDWQYETRVHVLKYRYNSAPGIADLRGVDAWTANLLSNIAEQCSCNFQIRPITDERDACATWCIQLVKPRVIEPARSTG